MNTCILPETVNYHFTSACNMQCRFCFAGFSECKQSRVSLQKQKEIIRAIAAAPMAPGHTSRRLNFVGGEPTVYPDLEELLQEAQSCGLRTSMVSNGFRLVSAGLSPAFKRLDILGLSIDSLNASTNRVMGRAVHGRTISAAEWMALFGQAGEIGLPIKINTTVTAYNVDEDLSAFIIEAAPKRWKIFQAMAVEGQNFHSRADWEADDGLFELFVRRHQSAGAEPVVEREALMRGSYAMISPDGRFFDSVSGVHTYSDPILSVGVSKAWRHVAFDASLFEERTITYGVEVAAHE